MTRIEWNKAGERLFEAGIDRTVLYPEMGYGVAWNGVVSIAESSSGGESQAYYYDGLKYLDVVANENFVANLEAFGAPEEFNSADGRKALSPGLYATQQPRKTFGLCYRTLIGNDLVGAELGYKLHLVYNCTASPTNRSNKTLAQNVSPDTKTWSINTVPPAADSFRPTAHLIVDSTRVDPYLMEELETMLYGRDEVPGYDAIPARLPTVAEIIDILANPITELIELTI